MFDPVISDAVIDNQLLMSTTLSLPDSHITNKLMQAVINHGDSELACAVVSGLKRDDVDLDKLYGVMEIIDPIDVNIKVMWNPTMGGPVELHATDTIDMFIGEITS